MQDVGTAACSTSSTGIEPSNIIGEECRSVTGDDNSEATDFSSAHDGYVSQIDFPKEKFNVLCPCTDITVGDVMFMVLSLGLRHGLTWDAQVDILKMMSTIFSQVNLPNTKFLYMKHVFSKTSQESIKFHVQCRKCDVYLGVKSSEAETALCENCQSRVSLSDESNFFASVSLESQLKEYLQDDKFVKLVHTYRFKQITNSRDLNDIYNGDIYKSFFENGGFLSSPYNMSFSFFTDGVQYGTSSNKTIWPIYLTINELPYKERSRYLILAGVYVGPKDPNQQVFLRPFVQEAKKLFNEGFSWIHEGRHVISRVVLLCCILDSVARYQVLNHQSFVAKYGCTFCYKQSSRTRLGQRYLVSAPAELRTEETLREDLKELYAKRHMTNQFERVSRGVKGPSLLMSLNGFILTKGVVVDYMHAICVGVVKHHIEMLLESTRKRFWLVMDEGNFAKKYLLAEIDRRIGLIQSNSSIIRELRPMTDVALWKASEFRSWLLFYMVVDLKGLLKEKYLLHFAILAKATYILLKSSVSMDEVKEAHRLFMLYTHFFQQYFGEENMRYNVHLLSHIARGVINFGPMWVHNSFLYEGKNRYLRSLTKSPNNVALQVTKKFLIYKSLPLLCSKIVTSEKAAIFSEKLLHYKNLKNCVRTADNDVLLGKGGKCFLSEVEFEAMQEFDNVTYEDEGFNRISELSYNRIISKNTMFCTESYSHGKLNNDSCVFTKSGSYAMIKRIIMLKSNSVVILGQEIVVSKSPCLADNTVKIDHLLKVVKRGGLMCFKPEFIAGPCIYMSSHDDEVYLSQIPFGCTVD